MTVSKYYCPQCGTGSPTAGICKEDGAEFLARSLDVSPQTEQVEQTEQAEPMGKDNTLLFPGQTEQAKQTETESKYYCPQCGAESPTAGICKEDGAEFLVRSLDVSPQTEQRKLDSLPGKVVKKLKGVVNGVTDDNSPEIPEKLSDLDIKSPPKTFPGYYQWLSTLPKKGKLHYRLFRGGSLTPLAIYERLQSRRYKDDSCFPLVESFGSVLHRGGIKSDYELTKADNSYSPADEWLNKQKNSEETAIVLAMALGDLLRDCKDAGVVPLSISPADLLVKKDGKGGVHLKFAHLGAMTEASGVEAHRGDLASASVLLSPPWAAPELVAGRKVAANSAIFSIGQLLCLDLFSKVGMLYDRVPDHNDICNGKVIFSRIRNEWLANLVMSCLWPQPDGRFSMEQFIEMLEKQNKDPEKWPKVTPWESLRVNGSAGFSFSGKLYFRLRDLAQVLLRPDNWDETISILPELLLWVRDNTHYESLARELLASDRSDDWKLIRLVYKAFPEFPKTWRSIRVDDDKVEDSLVNLAQKVLRTNKDTNNKDAKLIEQLFSADLSGAFPEQEVRQ